MQPVLEIREEARRPISRLAAFARTRWMWALAALIVVVNAIVFPAAVPHIGTSPSARPLDLRFGYSTDEARRALEAMGDTGRQAYLLVESTVDIAYPFLYALFFAALLAYLLQRAWPTRPTVHGLALVPVAAMCADLLENAGILVMLGLFPGPLTWVATVTSVFTMTKWSMLGAMMLTVLASLLGCVAARGRTGRQLSGRLRE